MSTIKVDTIQTTSGVEQYTAKAWGSLQCQGTVSIRASGNVSSLTDNAVGEFTVSYTAAHPTATYAFTSAASGIDSVDTARGHASGPKYSTGQLTSSTYLITSFGGSGYYGRIDYNWINFSVQY